MRAGAAALSLLLAGGCSSRPHVGALRDRARDAGRSPSVVMVERPEAPRAPRLGGVAVGLIAEREPDDDLQHAQPLELPKGVRGTIGPPIAPPAATGKASALRGDEDYYQWLVGGAGKQTARVELSGVPGLALVLEALDGDGQRIVGAVDAGPGEAQVIPNLAVEAGRTYYLRVRAALPSERGAPHGRAREVNPPPSDAAHSYTLVVTPSPRVEGEEEEPNDTPEQANPMAGAEASGYFGHRRDEDWLKLPSEGAPPGATVRLELSAVDGVAPSLRVADGAGKAIAEARGGRGDELRMRNAPRACATCGPAEAAGVTLLSVRAGAGYSGDLRWTLRTQLEAPLEGAEIEPNETRATATLVDARRGVSGFLWPGDVDVYRLHLDGPSIVRVDLAVPERVDAKLEWLDEGDHVRMKSDEGGPGGAELLPALFAAGGEVYLRVSARPRDTAFDAPYKLSFAVEADDGGTEHEPNGSAKQATPIAAGREVRGFLFPRGDEDWYRAATPAGAVTVTAEAKGGSRTPAIRILDERGVTIGAGKGAAASAPVPAGGGVFVVVRDASGKQGSSSEPYRLNVRFE